MLSQLRGGALSQQELAAAGAAAERRQPMFDANGSHSNDYWRKKSSNAIKMHQYQVPPK